MAEASRVACDRCVVSPFRSASTDRCIGAFSLFSKSSRERRVASLGRPVSVVAALTAGLEGVIPPSRPAVSAAVRPGEDGHESGSPQKEPARRFSSGGAAAGVNGNCDGGANPLDDNNGFLQLPGRDGTPVDRQWGGLLGGRYCFKRLIGVGTFAQIIEAEDTMSYAEPRKRVALKVTRAGLQGVGMQESQLLAFLARSPGFHGANVVEAHAAFELGEHWCFAPPLPITSSPQGAPFGRCTIRIRDTDGRKEERKKQEAAGRHSGYLCVRRTFSRTSNCDKQILERVPTYKKNQVKFACRLIFLEKKSCRHNLQNWNKISAHQNKEETSRHTQKKCGNSLSTPLKHRSARGTSLHNTPLLRICNMDCGGLY